MYLLSARHLRTNSFDGIPEFVRKPCLPSDAIYSIVAFSVAASIANPREASYLRRNLISWFSRYDSIDGQAALLVLGLNNLWRRVFSLSRYAFLIRRTVVWGTPFISDTWDTRVPFDSSASACFLCWPRSSSRGSRRFPRIVCLRIDNGILLANAAANK